MKTYNGHRSWNAWNVSLWIGNDEPLYRYAMDCIKWAKQWAEKARKGRWNSEERKREAVVNRATRLFMKYYQNEKTPDGAAYNALSVKLAIEGFIEN